MDGAGPVLTDYMKKVKCIGQQDFQGEIIHLKEIIARSDLALKEKDVIITDLEARLALFLEQQHTLTASLTAAREEVATVTAQKSALASEVENLKTVISEKENHNVLQLNEIKKVRDAATDFSDKYDHTYERLRAEQAKVVILQRQLLEQKAEYEEEVEKSRVEAAAMKAIAEDIRDKYTVMKETLDAKIAEQEEEITQLEADLIAKEEEKVRLLEETRRELEQDKMLALSTLQEQANMSRQELEERLGEDLRVLQEALECKGGAGGRLSMSTLQGIKGDKDAIKRLIATMTQLQQSYKDLDEAMAKLAQLEQALRVYKAQVSSQSQALSQQATHIASLQQQLGHDGGVPAPVQPTFSMPMSPTKTSHTPSSPGPRHTSAAAPPSPAISSTGHADAVEVSSLRSEAAALRGENTMLKDKLKQLAALSAKEVERLRGELADAKAAYEAAQRSTSQNVKEHEGGKSVDGKEVVYPPKEVASSSVSTSTPARAAKDSKEAPSAPQTPLAQPARRAREREPVTPQARSAITAASLSRSNSRVRDRSATPKRLAGNVTGYNSSHGHAATPADLEAMHRDKHCSCYAERNATRCAFAMLASEKTKTPRA